MTTICGRCLTGSGIGLTGTERVQEVDIDPQGLEVIHNLFRATDRFRDGISVLVLAARQTLSRAVKEWSCNHGTGPGKRGTGNAMETGLMGLGEVSLFPHVAVTQTLSSELLKQFLTKFLWVFRCKA